jgi:hypothetical protein
MVMMPTAWTVGGLDNLAGPPGAPNTTDMRGEKGGLLAAPVVRTVMKVTVFRALCFIIGHICYVYLPLAVELQNA